MVKFGYSQKATKFEKIFHLKFDATQYNVKFYVEDFFEFCGLLRISKHYFYGHLSVILKYLSESKGLFRKEKKDIQVEGLVMGPLFLKMCFIHHRNIVKMWFGSSLGSTLPMPENSG